MTLFRTAVAAAALAGSMAVTATPAPVWFVVAETTPEHGDSFLLPLTDPGHVADARALIANGPGDGVGSIVAATIAPGGDGFNRDLQREGQPLWSWHVSGLLGFPDVAAGDLATMSLQATSGGAFLQPDPVDTRVVGQASVRFSDCNTATLSFVFDDGPSGSVPLRRLVTMPGCYRR